MRRGRTNLQGPGGFTLIELSIVMLIIGILIAGALQVYGVWFIQQQNEQLEETLDVVRAALGDFIQDDPDEDDPLLDPVRYPCPASPTAKPGDGNYGVEFCPTGALGSCDNGVCVVAGTGGNVFIGAVPTVALGIAGKYMNDPFRNKFTYAVSADLTPEGALLPGGTGTGAITVRDDSNEITDTASFVLLSHGRDGAGSYTSHGAANPAGCRTPGGLDGDSENCDNGNAVFRVTQRMVTASNDDFYDDMAVFSFADNSTGWWEATDGTGTDIINKNPGNVGIGTDVPTTKLQIESLGDQAPLLVQGGGDAGIDIAVFTKADGTEVLKLADTGNISMATNGGNIGIGTDAPNTILDIDGEVGIGITGIACTNERSGAIRYVEPDDQLEYCAVNGGGTGIPDWMPIQAIPKDCGDMPHGASWTTKCEEPNIGTKKFACFNGKTVEQENNCTPCASWQYAENGKCHSMYTYVVRTDICGGSGECLDCYKKKPTMHKIGYMASCYSYGVCNNGTAIMKKCGQLFD